MMQITRSKAHLIFPIGTLQWAFIHDVMRNQEQIPNIFNCYHRKFSNNTRHQQLDFRGKIQELGPLGNTTLYVSTYNPELLFPIPRQDKREEIGIVSDLPFYGQDIWNAFELSWLNIKGKPEVCVVEFIFPCTSPMIVESKSLKLYLNSFNQTKFKSAIAVQQCLIRDLSQTVDAVVNVTVNPMEKVANVIAYQSPPSWGVCLDTLDVEIEHYNVKPKLLHNQSAEIVEETVHSHLLKSNCLVTGQPDWGSVRISYIGPQINHAGFLKYIISFREHNEFHEQCVERMFIDIQQRCSPTSLEVEARYTRRGGLDINPFRSTHELHTQRNDRLLRQ